MHELIRSLVRLAYPYGSIRRVRLGALRGMQFVVVPGMGGTYALGQDHWNFPLFGKRLHQGATVYDIGANCGQMALFFSRIVGSEGRVICFEPVPQNFAVLNRNIELNVITNVQTHCLALGADDRPKQFCYDEAHHTMGTFVDQMAKMDSLGGTIEVPCDTLDQFIARGNPVPDLLKIDVEGAGAEVLAGATHLLRTRRPAIYMEIHASNTSSSEWDALGRLRDEFGYGIQDINNTFDHTRGRDWDAVAWCEPSAGG